MFQHFHGNNKIERTHLKIQRFCQICGLKRNIRLKCLLVQVNPQQVFSRLPSLLAIMISNPLQQSA